MSRVVVALALVLLVAGPRATFAYFEQVEAGARLQGMGTAGAAMADDVTAYYWNPAGLVALSRTEAFAAYDRPYGTPGLFSGTLAVGGRGPGPLKTFGVAAAWHRYAISGAYAEDLWQVAAGRTVHRTPSGHEVAVGGVFKVGRVAITTFDDPDTGVPVDFGARTAVSLDTGLRWHAPWKVDLAWTAYDWLSPDYGFLGEGEAGAVPTRHRLAAAWAWNGESTVGAAWTSAGESGHSRLDVGIEIWFYNVFAIRSGLTDLGGLPDPGTTAQRFQYAGGVGLRNEKWRFDAAVATTRELGTSYRFSLIVPFGPSGLATDPETRP